MELNIQLTLDTDKGGSSRVKEAQKKKQAQEYIPTWREVWEDGYTAPSGKFKTPILKTKITDGDRAKLYQVRDAIEAGEIGIGVENLKKFSKAHALNLYGELKLKRRDAIIAEMLANIPDNYYLITDQEQLQHFVALADQEEELALDTETTGVEWEDTTVGFSMTLPQADVHFYAPYAHVYEGPQLTREEILGAFKPVMEKHTARLILFNAKFDAHMLRKDGVNIQDNIYWDAMVAQHVLNENEPKYALKLLANKYGKYFGYHDDSLTFEELFSKDPQEFIKADIRLAMVYACKDTHLTYLLYKWQKSMMEKQPKLGYMYEQIERPNTKVSIEMEKNGFTIDFDYSENYRKELYAEIQELERKLAETWPDVNLNSPKQLQELFYDRMGCEDVSRKKKVDAPTLKILAQEHPEIKLLLNYRELSKLYSTYIEPLPNLVHRDTDRLKGDNKLHGSFMQSGTVTGRYASKDPNLQNIPPQARGMIVAPEGKLIIGIDYSQIEPRTLASMSGDEGLREPYIKGIDLYSTLASRIFNLPYEACLESDSETYKKAGLPKHPRKMMKVGLLAVMYGIAVPSLAKSLGISKEVAQEFMDDFYKAYPVMSAWMDEQVAFTDKNGYVETMHGRKRRFPGHPDLAKRYQGAVKALKARNGGVMPQNLRDVKAPYDIKRAYWDTRGEYESVARKSVNAVIQGSAAEILKKAMSAVYEELKHRDGWTIIATIHDELLFEIPETATPEEIQSLADIMLNTTTLEIPIKSDIEVMTRWGSGIPFKQWIEGGCGREPFKA